MVGAPLEFYFPGLSTSEYKIKSNKDRTYNCIAFAAGETHRWWGPIKQIGYYWPKNIPRENNIECFIKAFKLLGYLQCEDDCLEPGFEKVALYVDDNKEPTHMARQLDNGKWISKLGKLEDIEHESLYVLEGQRKYDYGKVALFMKRPR